MQHSPTLDSLLAALPTIPLQHPPGSPLYDLLKQLARREVETLFRSDDGKPQFGPFGPLAFPYESMGAVDSLNLFDLDELILFSFYWRNRQRYRRVADIGANIGLHSIVMARCGFEVRSYEPDPRHFRLLKRNLAANACAAVTPVNAAVSRESGRMEFVRVLGNTTGSHLAGAKPAPYGDLERFPVDVAAFAPVLQWADLVKLDVEGHEAEIILGTTREHWLATDAVLEIGSEANARAVFDHLWPLGVGMFSQKQGWASVDDRSMMPTSYRDGSLFVTCRTEMPWNEPAAPAQRKAS
ncbi:MAG TPA: FkbM family methyltransferase [Pirellulales bacterium]|nr:FkbM family methyltransferase [Pirellulales bacterium]